MATGWGVGPDKNGNGTTPEDIQRITSAEYIWAGILNRCTVTGTTGMSYKVEGGAAVIQVGPVAKVKVPVFEQTIPTTAAPTVGSRTDIVYVKQNFPATDGDNAVVVGVGQTLPANALELDRFTVPAGVTSTNQCQRVGNPIFARPVGGQFGVLYSYTDTDKTVRGPGYVGKKGAGSFYLWTDSDLDITLTSTIANAAVNDNHGSVFYKIFVDDKLVRTIERKYERVWESKDFVTPITLDKGRHTVHYEVSTWYTPEGQDGRWRVLHREGAELFAGDIFTVNHRGVATL